MTGREMIVPADIAVPCTLACPIVLMATRPLDLILACPIDFTLTRPKE